MWRQFIHKNENLLWMEYPKYWRANCVACTLCGEFIDTMMNDQKNWVRMWMWIRWIEWACEQTNVIYVKRNNICINSHTWLAILCVSFCFSKWMRYLLFSRQQINLNNLNASHDSPFMNWYFPSHLNGFDFFHKYLFKNIYNNVLARVFHP